MHEIDPFHPASRLLRATLLTLALAILFHLLDPSIPTSPTQQPASLFQPQTQKTDYLEASGFWMFEIGSIRSF
ncbi:hypothetical protein [Baaleninema sp.]|uniref:hypothetical protein n=1 Tax=Baaleninema sp. TaxID=3101197 RepID=UPI003D015FA9